jgi:multisubunit Na+/H+ antiporter MnhF subunit
MVLVFIIIAFLSILNSNCLVDIDVLVPNTNSDRLVGIEAVVPNTHCHHSLLGSS